MKVKPTINPINHLLPVISHKVRADAAGAIFRD
jgi:hypothetical protein